MKLLYAIQGTGNGHVSRANEIIPILQKYAQTDVLISGNQNSLLLNFPITYRYKGLGFVFGTKGGIDLISTLKQNSFKSFIQEVRDLPVEKYDLVLTDFEPISAWAAKLKGVPCYEVSHQCAVLNQKLPSISFSNLLGRLILRTYCPSNQKFGFDFEASNSTVYTPVIRKEIRELKPKNNGYYTVYLPAFSNEKIEQVLNHFPQTHWKIFSKNVHTTFSKGHLQFLPVESATFISSLANCEGVLCGAGFETPSEALFLRKKLMVVPMKNQHEQLCNAAKLKEMGVRVIHNLDKTALSTIQFWIETQERVYVEYPDHTEEIIQQILHAFHSQSNPHAPALENEMVFMAQ
jgi:uncharacterized protein (TIGR00661 family)